MIPPRHRPLPQLLAILLLVAPCSAIASDAPAPPATPPEPPAVDLPGPDPAPALVESPIPPARPTWVDEGQSFFAERFLWSVERLDHFFADEREVDLPRARSFVRIVSPI